MIRSNFRLNKLLISRNFIYTYVRNKSKTTKELVSTNDIISWKINENVNGLNEKTIFYLDANDGSLALSLSKYHTKHIILSDYNLNNEENLSVLQNKFPKLFTFCGRYPTRSFIERKEIKNLEQSDWKYEPNVIVVSPYASNSHLKYSLNKSLLQKEFPFNFGRTPIFFLADDNDARILLLEKNDLEIEKRISPRLCLFVLLFDRQLIVNGLPKTVYNKKYSTLIKFQPKIDLFENFMNEKIFQEAHTFLKHFYAKPYERAILRIEEICPDIGIELIDMNISMLDKVKDVDINLIGKIYLLIRENKNYSKSVLNVLTAKQHI